MNLDLAGVRVVTEAATGPYVVTPVMAAAAGAEVVALAKDSRHGSAAEARRQTMEFAGEMARRTGSWWSKN